MRELNKLEIESVEGAGLVDKLKCLGDKIVDFLDKVGEALGVNNDPPTAPPPPPGTSG